MMGSDFEIFVMHTCSQDIKKSIRTFEIEIGYIERWN